MSPARLGRGKENGVRGSLSTRTRDDSRNQAKDRTPAKAEPAETESLVEIVRTTTHGTLRAASARTFLPVPGSSNAPGSARPACSDLRASRACETWCVLVRR